MKHEINFNNSRTDLIIEQIDSDIKVKKELYKDIIVSKVKLNKNNNLNKKQGTYITIEFEDITDIDNKKDIEKIFIKYLKMLLKNINTKRCLIIGLGNINSTADSLGPKVLNEIVITTHLLEISDLDEGFSEVAAYAPGVLGDTGIKSYDIIKELIKIIKPTYTIIIDSLVSNSINRLVKSIEMNNTGIIPGSGIGSNYEELSIDNLGIPVISIGIPTCLIVNKDSNNLFVSPIDIDFQIKKLSNLLSTGINKVIHPKLKIK